MKNRRGTDGNPEGGTDEKSDNQNTNFDQSIDRENAREEKIESAEQSVSTDKEKDEDPEFASFWSLYPNKDAKKKARQIFSRLSKKDRAAAFEKLPAAVEYWRMHERFVPLPTSWLNGRRWEDESLNHTTSPSPTKRHDQHINRPRPAATGAHAPGNLQHSEGFADIRV